MSKKNKVRTAATGPQAGAGDAQLDSLLTHLPGILYRCRADADWTLEYVAGDVQALTGYAIEELQGPARAVRIRDVMHPEDVDVVIKAARRVMEQGGHYTVEYRIRTKSGTERWIWDRGSAVSDARGRAVALHGFMQDISERRRVEQELRDSERLRRLMIEAEPECVKVVGTDGRLLEMNPAGLAMLEAGTLEQAQARPMLQFIAEEHREAFRKLHQRVMGGESGKLQFEVIGLKGTRRWLETHAVPMRDDSGTVNALLGVTRDVTASIEQQRRILRLSRTRAVMSGVNALIVRVRNRTELFQEACRIAVDLGGFRLAWVGLVTGGKQVVSVARHGEDHGHLSELKMELEEPDPQACAPTVQAVREGRRRVCNDISTDPGLGPWREPLQALGHGSFVAYPLLAGDQVVGCLNLYAAEPGFFDEEELKLLTELANDISFALEFIVQDEKLDYLAAYDSLTRLPNRSLFIRRLPGYIDVARKDSLRLALLIVDLERFKSINDAIGQEGGDALLKHIADRLTLQAGGSSFVARMGGDRFAVLIPGIGPGEDVEAQIRGGGWNRLDTPFNYRGHEVSMSCKLGLAIYPQDATDAEGLLRNAELALKQGKATGQPQTRYTDEIGAVASHKGQLTQNLRRAIDNDELLLHYQPKVELRTGKICGAEALLRWQSPNQGLTLPGNIVPLLEETGMILEVGRWVLKQALLDRARWLAQGLAVPRIGVNVSYVELRDAEYADSVKATLEGFADAAAGIELEVTESTMMANPDTDIATLKALRDLGLTVAMDDFGTGYSSLAYLARLPINVVKIDRSFIVGMATSPDTMNIVSSIVTLAHSMNLRVVAEGVDAPEQVQLLRALRCDEIQGFLFSKPLPADAFAALLREGRRLA